MKRFMKAATVACLLSMVSTSAATAAPVQFVGTVAPGDANFAAGTPVSFVADYTPVAATSTDLTSAMLTIGGQTWSVGAVVGGLTLNVVAGANNDTLNFSVPNFGSSTPGGFGSLLSAFSLTFTPGLDATDLTLANVSALTSFGTPGSGVIFLNGGAGVTAGLTSFSGTAVPEPGSVILLSGLGLFFGYGAWRRKKQAQLVA